MDFLNKDTPQLAAASGFQSQLSTDSFQSLTTAGFTIPANTTSAIVQVGISGTLTDTNQAILFRMDGDTAGTRGQNLAVFDFIKLENIEQIKGFVYKTAEAGVQSYLDIQFFKGDLN